MNRRHLLALLAGLPFVGGLARRELAKSEGPKVFWEMQCTAAFTPQAGKTLTIDAARYLNDNPDLLTAYGPGRPYQVGDRIRCRGRAAQS